MEPIVSVVMTTYNSERFLREAVESILKQTFGDFEFIIVDDNSTDNTVNIIKEFNDYRIRLVQNSQWMSFVPSLNRGIGLASGKYIANMDSDDISMPNRLAIEVDYLDKNPDVDIVSTFMIRIDEAGKELCQVPLETRKIKDKLLDYNCVCQGCALFRPRIMEGLGGYSNDFRYAADYDFWLRASEHYKIRNIDQFLYLYRINKRGESQTHLDEQKREVLLIRQRAKERRNKIL